VGERAVDRQVDVLVDRRGDHGAAGAAVVRRQVGAAPADRDAQGGPGDDHCATAPTSGVPARAMASSGATGTAAAVEPRRVKNRPTSASMPTAPSITSAISAGAR